jgi:GT2 family glycosyltransferase
VTSVNASVIVPTLGRLELLPACLESLLACEPRAEEIIIVAQGELDGVAELVSGFKGGGVRLVPCSGRGKALGVNIGLREAKHDLVLITDDDCRVHPSWVGVASKQLAGSPGTIVTGRVLPAGSEQMVPTRVEDPDAHDYTGPDAWGALCGGNMACSRDALLALGGFDERFGRAAGEDDDMSYRWASAGGRIRYDPEFLIWHADWRTPDQLTEVYAGYAREQGRFFGMHLRHDFRLIVPIIRYFYAGLRAIAAGLVHRRPLWTDPRSGIVRGLPGGIIAGWRAPSQAGEHRKAEASCAEPTGLLRRAVRRARPVRSTWHLLRAIRAAIDDGSRANRRRVDDEFAAPDPWNYAGSRREQDCFAHQLAVLDRARSGGQFGETWEVGCAEGYFTEPLAGRCESLLAVDLSEAALARARRRHDWADHVRFARFDLRADPLPGRFDLIVIAGVLEYLDRPSALAAARQRIVGALRPGGQLFVVTTRNLVAEKAWWGRMFRRGTRINEYVGGDPRLVTRTVEEADWYVISLFERRG